MGYYFVVYFVSRIFTWLTGKKTIAVFCTVSFVAQSTARKSVSVVLTATMKVMNVSTHDIFLENALTCN